MLVSTTGSKASRMRRSLSALTISSAARTFSRRSASRSTFGRYIWNEPSRFVLARSSVSCARARISGTVRRMARRGDAADGDGCGHRTRAGADHVVAHARNQPLGGLLHVVRRAVVENDAELVAGEAAELIAAAHLGAQALGHRADRLIGDVEAIGLVDAREIVDRHQHEAAGAALRHRLRKRRFQHLGQMKAVHLAGEPVEARQIGEPLFLVMPVVDDADNAVRARGLAVAAGEPAADVLDPQRLLGARRLQRVLHLIRNARACIASAATSSPRRNG